MTNICNTNLVGPVEVQSDSHADFQLWACVQIKKEVNHTIDSLLQRTIWKDFDCVAEDMQWVKNNAFAYVLNRIEH